MNFLELERMRKRANFILYIGVIISVLFALLMYILSKEFFHFLLFLLLGIFLTHLISLKPQRKFILAFKESLVFHAMRPLFQNFVYEPNKKLDKSIIKKTGVSTGMHYHSNDFVSGIYKNISVMLADVQIEERYTRQDIVQVVSLFYGRWMVYEFCDSFKADFVICQKGFNQKNIFSSSGYKKILVGDLNFQNNFTVFVRGDQDIFTILTSSLMQKIRNITAQVSGKFFFCFMDNQLHIGLQNHKNSFEHSIFQKIIEEEVMQKITKDVEEIQVSFRKCF